MIPASILRIPFEAAAAESINRRLTAALEEAPLHHTHHNYYILTKATATE